MPFSLSLMTDSGMAENIQQYRKLGKERFWSEKGQTSWVSKSAEGQSKRHAYQDLRICLLQLYIEHN